MDECPQHIRHVVSEARNLWPELMTADTARLGECEFSLISSLNSQLIVHHPYRTLLDLQGALGLSNEEVAVAWWVVNDAYLTDAMLLFAPHVVALAAVGLPVVLKPSVGGVVGGGGPGVAVAVMGSGAGGKAAGKETKSQRLIAYLATSGVDIEDVVDATQEIVSLYECWEGFTGDKAIKEAMARLVKGGPK
jgi:cyclin C